MQKTPDVTKMKPECPYCGEPMEPSVECSICRFPVNHPDYWPCSPEWNYRISFVCKACTTRTTNTLHSPVEHAETEEEALAKAYSSATKKRKEYETKMHNLIQQLEFKNGELLEMVEMLKEQIEEYEESADKCCFESRCNAELNKLEALCKRLRDENEQLEAERDAMMQDMNRSCFICKHFNGGVECLNTVCAKCVRWCNWEWRGVQKEE